FARRRDSRSASPLDGRHGRQMSSSVCPMVIPMKLDEVERLDKKKALSVAPLRLASRILRVSFEVYLAGCVVTGIILVWSAVDNGGLQRQHSLREWLVIAVFYVVSAGLWPIMLVVVVLMYFRIIHGPIEVPNPFL